MLIEDIIAARNITEIIHFTTYKGVLGTLHSGALLSRQKLPENKHLEHILHYNSAFRPEASDFFDKSENWLDFVNLSVSEINRRYFDVSKRWHPANDIWWGILSFDPVILTHPGVYFATTNNSYESCCLRNTGAEGLESIFVDSVPRKRGWTVTRKNRAAHLPTCEQAEVLYPGSIPIQHLKRIYVQRGEDHDIARAWLREYKIAGVEVLISLEKFRGQPN